MAIRNPAKGRNALSDFEKEFVAARRRGDSVFTYRGKEYTTERADRPNEGRSRPDRTASYVESRRRAAQASSSPQVKNRPAFDPNEEELGLEAVRPEEFLGGAGKIAATGLGLLGAGAAARAGLKRYAAKKAEQQAIAGTVRSNRDPLMREAKILREEQRAAGRKEQLAGREREATQRDVERMESEGGRAFRKGGAVKKAQKPMASRKSAAMSKPAAKAKPAAPRKPVRRRRP